MRVNGINPTVVRAGKANLFLSDVFTQSFAGATNMAVEFYEGDGSYGAAIGAGIGAGIYKDAAAASKNRKPVGRTEPANAKLYNALYEKWKERLMDQLNTIEQTNAVPMSLS
jgi:xylulokinase